VTEQQRSPDEIRDDIEQTREDLGDTAAALAEKTDLKQQAKAKVSDVKQKASEKKDEVAGKAKDATPDSAGAAMQQAQHFAKENPTVVAAGAALLVGFVLGRRRSRR